MALAFTTIGDEKLIQDFKGNELVKRRLMDLGFVKGERVKVLSENPSGQIVMVKGVKVAIDRSLALKIMVA